MTILYLAHETESSRQEHDALLTRTPLCCGKRPWGAIRRRLTLSQVGACRKQAVNARNADLETCQDTHGLRRGPGPMISLVDAETCTAIPGTRVFLAGRQHFAGIGCGKFGLASLPTQCAVNSLWAQLDAIAGCRVGGRSSTGPGPD